MKPMKCPACSGEKRPRLYLCPGCWATLQPATRRALNRRDDLAVVRLRDLYDQLQRDVPLRQIEVTP